MKIPKEYLKGYFKFITSDKTLGTVSKQPSLPESELFEVLVENEKRCPPAPFRFQSPQMAECAPCSGSGYTSQTGIESDIQECTACNGSGESKMKNKNFDAWFAEVEKMSLDAGNPPGSLNPKGFRKDFEEGVSPYFSLFGTLPPDYRC